MHACDCVFKDRVIANERRRVFSNLLSEIDGNGTLSKLTKVMHGLVSFVISKTAIIHKSAISD